MESCWFRNSRGCPYTCTYCSPQTLIYKDAGQRDISQKKSIKRIKKS